MRSGSDRRPDYVVKAELLERILDDGTTHRDQTVRMWRAKGVPAPTVDDRILACSPMIKGQQALGSRVGDGCDKM